MNIANTEYPAYGEELLGRILPKGRRSQNGPMQRHRHDKVRKGILGVAAIAVTVAIAGCGAAASLPEAETGTVQGSVTYQGEPVPSGSTVVFTNQKYGIPATGQVGKKGTYKLQMRGRPDILVGDYQVSITPPADTRPEMTDAEYEKMMAEGKGPVSVSKKASPPPFPERYTAAGTSGLSFQVNAGDNTYQISLEE